MTIKYLYGKVCISAIIDSTDLAKKTFACPWPSHIWDNTQSYDIENVSVWYYMHIIKADIMPVVHGLLWWYHSIGNGVWDGKTFHLEDMKTICATFPQISLSAGIKIRVSEEVFHKYTCWNMNKMYNNLAIKRPQINLLKIDKLFRPSTKKT